MTTATAPTREDIARARDDVEVFARVLAGEPLWPHQAEVANDPARFRCMKCGRQAGKTRTLAIVALHFAFATADKRVLIMSAGEESAKDLVEDISGLVASPLLRGSLVEDNKSLIVLSNGSTIRSVPASTKQARGKAIDLLILDEAAFIDEELWTAAKYTIIARPGSRVVMSSSPWGRADHFFNVTFREGESGSPEYSSYRWPSHVSPLVDKALLESWRQTTSDREYRREVLAEDVDEAGAYFTTAELQDAVADYRLIDPKTANGQMAVAGVDWGVAHDANALVTLAALSDGDLNLDLHPQHAVFFIPWLEQHFNLPYVRFIDRIVESARKRGSSDHRESTRARSERLGKSGFAYRAIASETNGVGQMPTEVLARELRTQDRVGAGAVIGIHTDARRKMTAFGTIKLLLQNARLILPRHPDLLRQLSALEYETQESGNVRIAVAERFGHDDVAMALSQASSCLNVSRVSRMGPAPESGGEVLQAANGARINESPRCWDNHRALTWPKGSTQANDW